MKCVWKESSIQILHLEKKNLDIYLDILILEQYHKEEKTFLSEKQLKKTNQISLSLHCNIYFIIQKTGQSQVAYSYPLIKRKPSKSFIT